MSPSLKWLNQESVARHDSCKFDAQFGVAVWMIELCVNRDVYFAVGGRHYAAFLV